jgi:hypothetical protein
MTVSLPQEKKEIIANEWERLLSKQTANIRGVARVLGLIVSIFTAVDHARLYYREIEKAKIIALIKSCGNFDAPMEITSNMREELNWWFTNVYKQKNSYKARITKNHDSNRCFHQRMGRCSWSH